MKGIVSKSLLLKACMEEIVVVLRGLPTNSFSNCSCCVCVHTRMHTYIRVCIVLPVFIVLALLASSFTGQNAVDGLLSLSHLGTRLVLLTRLPLSQYVLLVWLHRTNYIVVEMKLYSHVLSLSCFPPLFLLFFLLPSLFFLSLLQSYPSQEHIHHQVGSLNESLTSEDLCTIVGAL